MVKVVKKGKKSATAAAVESVKEKVVVSSSALAVGGVVKGGVAKKWRNKQRVLLISSRGVSYLARHILDNLRHLMPHTKTESKFDNKHQLRELSEIAEIRNCNKVIYLEMYKRQDAYLWLSAQPHGPSAKFSLVNMHTMEELRLTGNCLKGSRPLLSFSEQFDTEPQWRLIKELFVQTFGTPYHHPKSQPFVDHVLNFTLLDGKIWVRNYQIGDEVNSLAEVGPRFVLNLVKLFDGCFGGAVLYENPRYVPPVVNRRLVKEKAAARYNNRVAQKMSMDTRRAKGDTFETDQTDEVFKI